MSIALADLGSARALRARALLEPIDGPDGRIFPPTAMPADKRDKETGHVFEEGRDGLRVLVDSCASQANRQELALLQAREAGRIELSDIEVDLNGTASVRKRVSTLEMPHRIADAILRDSEIDGIAFTASPIGQRILSASFRDLSAILEASPASLVFGTWFSQHGLGSWGLKIERASASEIWGYGAQRGKAVGSRIDPLNLTTMPIYATPDGSWTTDEGEAVKDGKGRAAPFGKKTKTSELNHSNIPPTVVDRGVICDRYDMRWSLNGAAIQRQGFGSQERDVAAHRYLAALGLLARVLAHEDGYALRSRCLLLATEPLKIEVITRDGQISEHELDGNAAIELLKEAQAGLQQAGFAEPKLIQAKPSRRLIGLIAKSREAAPSEEAA
jgi:CRISPR-associated protein Csb1